MAKPGQFLDQGYLEPQTITISFLHHDSLFLQ